MLMRFPRESQNCDYRLSMSIQLDFKKKQRNCELTFS
ncbi:hypothetical protein J2X02_000933 [Pseudoxanthomonas japonensis]|nr:hypothetical protein [Pseudoxanthomonas japonensis]